MTPLLVFQTALSSLGANKLRAGLTLLGIVIGVAAVISLMAIGEGAQQQITSRIQSLGSNLLFVRPGSTQQGGVSQGQGSANTLSLADAYALKDPLFAPNVAAVAPEVALSGQFVAGRLNTSTQVYGVTPEYAGVRNFKTQSGQFITQAHIENRTQVAVLGPQLSRELFGNLNPVGQTLRLNGLQFEVIGLLESKGGTGFGNQDNLAMIPLTTAHYRLSGQRAADGGIRVQNINVQITDEKHIQDGIREVATILRLRHRIIDADDFTITSQQETLDTLQQTTQIFVIFLGSVAGISLLVGGIGVMNIMLVSVTERTREIGIRKAMGAKRRDILLQFITEATLLALSGGVMGVAIGWGLAQLLDGASVGPGAFRTAFSGDIALLALGVSAAIGLFFGIYPAMRAARLHPIEALRHE